MLRQAIGSFLWLAFFGLLYIAADALLPRPIPSAVGGVVGPTVLPARGAQTSEALCYTALDKGQPPALLAVPLAPGEAGSRVLVAPSPWRSIDVRGAMNAQFVPGDRLYYVGVGRDGRRRACIARLQNGAVSSIEDAHGLEGVTWLSVLPPGEDGGLWRVWCVVGGRVETAASTDGRTWAARRLAFAADGGGRIETVSVLPWQGGLRAWYVQRLPGHPEGELLSVLLAADTGEPSDTPETVAWQAPELRFGNLPRQAIPIVDARAAPIANQPRGLRLYISYRGDDGRPRITVAENFPVVGEREPTIFARQAKPLVEPGKVDGGPGIARAVVKGLILAIGITAAAAAWRRKTGAHR